jgi:malonate-semialdehyde dehydrogenase (acetylating)/methylmalonate-semialdehyde dehydrogenase
MAASVLLTIGPQQNLLDALIRKGKLIIPGTTELNSMGPVIDVHSLKKIKSYIQKSVDSGAEILLDGRLWDCSVGNFIGPTIILHKNRSDVALHDEIFGTNSLFQDQ